MCSAQLAWLNDRGVVSVIGADARKLLQGIITNDIDVLDRQPAILAGLLSPQGKILFEFLVAQATGGYLLEAALEQAQGLAKRLSMYRLRSDVRIVDVSETHAVAAIWGDDGEATIEAAVVRYRDPRDHAMGTRSIAPRGSDTPIGGASVTIADAIDYHAHRIALGVPEGGKDYDFGDAFPHEANFDLIGGVSFEKGCYVGQEIVSRMEHRATVRKRVVRVSGSGSLPGGRPDIAAGDIAIGRLGSVAGRRGLGLVRLDRVIEAIEKGQAITAGGTPLEIDSVAIERHRQLLSRKAQRQ
jgi:folate-binding protein YgfZ